MRVFALALAVGHVLLGSGVCVRSAPILVVARRGRCGDLGPGVDAPADRPSPGSPSAEAVAWRPCSSAHPLHAEPLRLPRRAADRGRACATAASPPQRRLLVAVLLAAARAVAERIPPPTRCAESAAVVWLGIGRGPARELAVQSRSIRDDGARQAPYATAHQLMAQLHALASRASVGLDSAAARRRPRGRPAAPTPAPPVRGLRPWHRPTSRCARRRYGDDAARWPTEIERRSASRTPGVRSWLPRRGPACWATCVLVGVPRWTDDLTSGRSQVADEFALRLDTAVLFDDVRTLATSEERNRIAREMHDGVAQEIVAPRLHRRRDRVHLRPRRRPGRWPRRCARRSAASSPRSASPSSTCATRSPTAASPAPLAEYVREVSHGHGPAGPPLLDESGPPLPPGPRPSCCASPRKPSATCAGTPAPRTSGSPSSPTARRSGSRSRTTVSATPAPANATGDSRPCGSAPPTIGAHLAVTPRHDGGTVVRLRTPDHRPPEGDRCP